MNSETVALGNFPSLLSFYLVFRGNFIIFKNLSTSEKSILLNYKIIILFLSLKMFK